MGKRTRQAESVTEMVPQLAAPYAQAVADALQRHGAQAGALLPVLHAIQDTLGFVPEGAVAPIAEVLNLTRADVHGVISFYHEFRRTPPARHSLRLCRAEACQAMGARALEQHACERLGIHGDAHHSADGEIDFEPVYCLGNCALAPAGLIDGELRGRLTPEAIDTAIAAMRSAKGRNA